MTEKISKLGIVLVLIGGLIIILASYIAYLGGPYLAYYSIIGGPYDDPSVITPILMEGESYLIGVVFGILVLIGAFLSFYKHAKAGGIAVIAFSVLPLLSFLLLDFTGVPFLETLIRTGLLMWYLIGLIISVIGGILILKKRDIAVVK